MSCGRTWSKRKWLDWDFSCWGAMRKRMERNLQKSKYKYLCCKGSAGLGKVSRRSAHQPDNYCFQIKHLICVHPRLSAVQHYLNGAGVRPQTPADAPPLAGFNMKSPVAQDLFIKAYNLSIVMWKTILAFVRF